MSSKQRRVEYCVKTMLSTGCPCGITMLKAAVPTDLRNLVQPHVDNLVYHGVVEKTKKGKYILTEKGYNYMKLDALDDLSDRPRNSPEWLDLFGGEQRAKIITAIRKHQPAKIYPILSALDESPYPFSRATFVAFCARVKASDEFK